MGICPARHIAPDGSAFCGMLGMPMNLPRTRGKLLDADAQFIEQDPDKKGSAGHEHASCGIAAARVPSAHLT